MRKHPSLEVFKTMEFGFKRRDFLAFLLFPRVWKEIERLRSRVTKLQHQNKHMQDLILNNYIEEDTK